MYIRLDSQNVVRELIPDTDPAFPEIPIEKRYTPEFVAQLVHVPDDTTVQHGWTYDPESGTFADVPVPSPEPTYTTEDLLSALLGG